MTESTESTQGGEAAGGSAASNPIIDEIRAGYAFEGAALEFGAAVVDGTAHPDARVRIPLSAMNRHGLVAGATGTGKTKTLQLMAEQLAACMAGRAEPAAGIAEGLRSLVTAQAIDEAMERGAVVDLRPYWARVERLNATTL